MGASSCEGLRQRRKAAPEAFLEGMILANTPVVVQNLPAHRRPNILVRSSRLRHDHCFLKSTARRELSASRCSSRTRRRLSSSCSAPKQPALIRTDSHQSIAQRTSYLFRCGNECSSIWAVARRGLHRFHRLQCPEKRRGNRLCSVSKAIVGT